jgi:hypothetical protein
MNNKKKKKTIVHKFKNVMDKIITLIKKKTKQKQHKQKQNQSTIRKQKKPIKHKKQPTKKKQKQVIKHKKQPTKKKQKQVIKHKKQPTKKKQKQPTKRKQKKQPTNNKSSVNSRQRVRRKAATMLKYDTLKDSMLKNSMLKKSALKDYISNNSKNYSFNEKEAEKSTNPISNYAPKSSIRNKSYIPSINNKLQIRSLRTLPQLSINLCDSLLELNISTTNNDVCLPYNSNKVKDILLHNLKASKHLDVTKFIPPVQFLSNCWFNTMFVTFFFSDKGRVFFRFFRELMITGKKIDGEPIQKNLRELFSRKNKL